MAQPNSTFVALELYQTKVKGVSVSAGTRGFHGSEKVWGAHTWVLCLFCLVSLEQSLEMSTVQSILQGRSTH